MRKPVSLGFPIRFDTNWAVQPKKTARGLKIWILEVEGLYYLCSQNKGADQLCGVLSAPLFSMQKAGFLMTLIRKYVFALCEQHRCRSAKEYMQFHQHFHYSMLKQYEASALNLKLM